MNFSCSKIPEAFLDKNVAKRHFEHFGRIKEFTLHPKRLTCTVEYTDRDSAESALLEGNYYDDLEFDISFTTYTATQNKQDSYLDPDVQDELNAMAGYSKSSRSVKNGLILGYSIVISIIKLYF